MSPTVEKGLLSPIIIASVILSVALIICAIVAYVTVTSTDHSASLTVTGFASKEDIVADSAALTITLNSDTATQADLSKVQSQIQNILTQAGLSPDDLTLTSTSNSPSSGMDGASDSAMYSSWQLDIHTKNAQALNKVIVGGMIPSKIGKVTVSLSSPDYFVSDISSSRNAIIQQAIQDAHSRAQTIAQADGVHLGALRMIEGVTVSVVPKGTVSASDYSSSGDDTSSLNKSIVVSVSEEYDISR